MRWSLYPDNRSAADEVVPHKHPWSLRCTKCPSAKCVLATEGYVEEAVTVLMFLVDLRHTCTAQHNSSTFSLESQYVNLKGYLLQSVTDSQHLLTSIYYIGYA